MATYLPAQLVRRGPVLRPRDAHDVYAFPAQEFRRLERRGALVRAARGYYLVVPPAWSDAPQRWRPDIAAIGLGIAHTDYPAGDVALMGISAARHHRAIPRALGTAVIAVPKQRPDLHTGFGTIFFVTRTTPTLDLERATTELTDGWVTTTEQTILDLAARPTLGGLTPGAVAEAITALAAEADWSHTASLAAGQHKSTALQRARWVVWGAEQPTDRGPLARPPADTKGLTPATDIRPSP